MRRSRASSSADKVWKVLEKGTDELGADRPWLDLLRASDRRRRRRRQPQARRQPRPGATTPATSAPTSAPPSPTPSAATPTSATSAAKACSPPSSSSSDRDSAPPLRPRAQDRPRVAAALLDRGVIGRAMPQGDILGFAPPLCLTRAEADTIVAAAKGAVEEIASTL